jgi:DNA-binding response OmpR family regulator
MSAVPEIPATRSILIVDDDGEITEMTRLILEGAGYAIRLASSGTEALASIAERRPDLLLLDVNMPGMDGWEVLRLLKIEEETRGIPVVMFSVKMEVRDKVHALQEGALDYITKPFSYDELVERVGRIFEKLEVSH